LLVVGRDGVLKACDVRGAEIESAVAAALELPAGSGSESAAEDSKAAPPASGQ
jgi:hypothetical protein